MLLPCCASDADLRIRGTPVLCTTAMSFHIARHWGQAGLDVHPTDGRSWDALADDLDARFLPHVWHPDHWIERLMQPHLGTKE